MILTALAILIAEFTPPTEIVVWLGCAFFILSIYVKFQEARRLSSPPATVSVQETPQPVSRREFDKLAEDVKDMETKLDEITKNMHSNHVAILNSVERHSGDLQTRINGLVLEVAKIKK